MRELEAERLAVLHVVAVEGERRDRRQQIVRVRCDRALQGHAPLSTSSSRTVTRARAGLGLLSGDGLGPAAELVQRRARRWARAVCRRPAPVTRTAWPMAFFDPTRTTSFLARVTAV